MLTIGKILGVTWVSLCGVGTTAAGVLRCTEKRINYYEAHEGEVFDEKTKKINNFKDNMAYFGPVLIGTAVTAGVSLLAIAVDDMWHDSMDSNDSDDDSDDTE